LDNKVIVKDILFRPTSRIANSLRPLRVTVGRVALADIPVCRESGSTRFSSIFCS